MPALYQSLPPHRPISPASLLLLACLLFSGVASANLISGLSKLGKLGEKADIGLPLSKIELPDNIKAFAPVSIKPDLNGEWHHTLPDGSLAPLDSLVAGSKKPALVIQSSDLPRHLDKFDSLPADWPLLIQGKKGKLFELKRGQPPALIYQQVQLTLSDMTSLRDGLWTLQRPAFGKSVRLLQLNSKTSAPLADNQYGSKVGIEPVSETTLLDAMPRLKNQTVVLSGRLVEGKLVGADKGAQGVKLKQLQQTAEAYDINLVILESSRPDTVLKKLSSSLTKSVKENGNLHDTLGDFYNRLHDPKNPMPLQLHSKQNGEQQLAIQWHAAQAVAPEKRVIATTDMLSHTPLHLLITSSSVYTPDPERGKELNSRIIPNIPSSLQFYVISSVILGFIALGTSWALWQKVWYLRSRCEYQHLMLFILLWPLHRLLFVLLFIPLFGNWSFLWMVLKAIYWVLNVTLLRPGRWIYRQLASIGASR